VQAALTIVAAFYAYRVTKVVGLFWAWGAIVAAFVINAGSGLMSLSTLFLVPADQLSALISQFNSVQIWLGQAVSLTSAFLLAAGMYGLLRIFGAKKSAEQASG